MSATAVVPSIPSPAEGGAVHRHLVEFYEDEASLAGAVTRFLAPATAELGTALVVATPAHRAAFERALAASGVDVVGTVAAGRYLTFDAAELLSTFMVDGAPDEAAFRREVGGLVERLTAGGHSLRIYGEMVALLWQGGDVASAVALEDHWNGLRAMYDFDLLCAYSMSSFDNEEEALAFRRVCEQHECRPEQVLLAELAYADAVATVFNRRAAGTDAPALRPRRCGDDTLVLAAWRNASQLMASPGGRVLGDIVATNVR
jgi:hypothetical protein